MQQPINNKACTYVRMLCMYSTGLLGMLFKAGLKRCTVSSSNVLLAAVQQEAYSKMNRKVEMKTIPLPKVRAGLQPSL